MRTLALFPILFLVGGCGNGASQLPPPHGGEPDADGDGVPASQDCNDADAHVWRMATVYSDGDGDGVGDGAGTPACIGADAPRGSSLLGGDCAPADAARWQTRSFTWRDADGDGWTVPSAGEVCSGGALPAGYTNQQNGLDCDDADASVYYAWSVVPDADGDGVGAGAATTICGTSQRPAGYSDLTGDCAPDDATRWQALSYAYVDADGDGYTVASSGSVCSGASLPAGYGNVAHGNDCDDGSAAAWQTWSVWPDTDGDAIGAGTMVQLCAGASTPHGYATIDGDCAPDDFTRFRLLAYSFVDGDADSYTVATSGMICTGARCRPAI